MLGFHEIVSFYIGLFSALIIALGTLYVSFSTVKILIPFGTVAQRACGQGVVAISLLTLGFHLLASMGIFRIMPATLAIILVTAVARMFGQSFSSCLLELRNDVRLIRQFLCKDTSRFQKLILTILAGIAICVGMRCLLLPPLGWDALNYHAVKPGMWVQQGHVWLMNAPGAWNSFRSFQGGGEAILAWAMLPFHGDFLLCCVDVAYWFFLMAALYALGRFIGLGRKLSFAGAIFCGYLPVIVFSVGVCDVDIALGLWWVTAALFLPMFFDTLRPQCLLLGCLSLGLAGGVKITAYPQIGLALALTGMYLLVSRQLSVTNLRWCCLGVVAMLCLAAPWQMYNYQMTGDPFYPFGVSLFGLSWGPKGSAMEWMQSFPIDWGSPLWNEITVLLKLFYFPPYDRVPNLGIFSLVPLVWFPIGIIALIKLRFWTGLLLFSISAGVLIFFYWPSFYSVRHFCDWINARFLLGPAFLAIMASLFAVRNMDTERRSNLLLVLSCLQIGPAMFFQWTSFDFRYLVLSWAILLLIAGLLLFLRDKLGTLAPRVIAVVFCLGLAGLIYVARVHIRYESADNCKFSGWFPTYWIDAAQIVDSPGIARKIAVTTGPRPFQETCFMYMFLGRSLQNRLEYVPASALGESVDLRLMFPGSQLGDYRLWLDLIRERGITDVMSFRPRSMELSWMLNHPESFEPLSQGPEFGLFRVRSMK